MYGLHVPGISWINTMRCLYPIYYYYYYYYYYAVLTRRGLVSWKSTNRRHTNYSCVFVLKIWHHVVSENCKFISCLTPLLQKADRQSLYQTIGNGIYSAAGIWLKYSHSVFGRIRRVYSAQCSASKRISSEYSARCRLGLAIVPLCRGTGAPSPLRRTQAPLAPSKFFDVCVTEKNFQYCCINFYLQKNANMQCICISCTFVVPNAPLQKDLWLYDYSSK